MTYELYRYENPGRTMNSPDNHEPRAVELGGAVPRTCFVCGDPVGEHCFCRIHQEQGEPIMLCCPSCTFQYIDSRRVPDMREQELRTCENSVNFFIGEEWTSL